jgi:hypothetical protein
MLCRIFADLQYHPNNEISTVLDRIRPFFNRIVTFNMICFLSVLGNTWTLDATFQDTEFTQIAMYSPTRGIASTSQSVLHSHNIGELRV